MIKELVPTLTDSPLTKTSQVLEYFSSDCIGQYSVVNRLVISGQAMVFLCSKDGQLFVLKVYQPLQKNQRVFKDQVQILQKLEYPSILPLISFSSKCKLQLRQHPQLTTCSYICMPYLENGDLLEWILTRKYLPEKQGRYLAQQLVGALRYLQNKRIFHRDIKPQNILINDDYKPTLIDFGLAVQHRYSVKGFVGTSRCSAPQIIKQRQYTFKSEVYSLGIVLFFTLTGHYPYHLAKLTDTGYRLLFQQKYKQYWSSFEQKAQVVLSSSFKQLFLKMTHHNPEKRPSLDDLMDFDWFRQGGASQQEYHSFMKKNSFLSLQ